MASSNAIDLARRHAQALKKIPVPYWTEDPAKPFVVHARGIRPATFRTCKTLATNSEGFFDDLLFAALVIEYTALDEAGERLFKPGAHRELMEDGDGDVIMWLHRELISAQRTLTSQKDLKKS